MRKIIYLLGIYFLFSSMVADKKNKNQLDMNTKTFLNQLNELQLPYSENQLKNLLLENDGRETFDENLFDKLDIKPINNYHIFHKDKVHYPVGKISSEKITLLLTMHKKNEAGVLDPVIYAYILDHRQAAIKDSMVIYYNFNWEDLLKISFNLNKDIILTVKREETSYPFYGETENEDLMTLPSTNERVLMYQIEPTKMKFIRYYDQDGTFANEWEKGFVRNHTREGRWEDIAPPYVIDSEYSIGYPNGEWIYYYYNNEFKIIGNQVKVIHKKTNKIFMTEKYKNGEFVSRQKF